MNLIIDSKPYMLYETIEMVFKYVNNISICDIRDTLRRVCNGYCDNLWLQRLSRLQEIVEDCCKDLDPEDEVVQYYFKRVDTGCVREFTSLARVITLSFLQFRHHDISGELQALKDYWKRLQEVPYSIPGFSVSGLEFRPLAPGMEQQSLFMQIYALDYPAEFKLEIIKVLQDYDRHLDQLAQFLMPYAQRLSSRLEEESWLIQSVADYWREQFQEMTPESFLGSPKMMNQVIPETDEKRVCFSLMHCSELFWDFAGNTPLGQKQSLFIFGCATVAQSSIRRISGDAERICAILRSISDKNKFEILRKLSKTRDYCQKLAEELHCDKGNLSRSLAVLHNYGFLIQEPEQTRVYYRTDIEGIEAFLEEVRYVLTGKS